jgi:hypothetical protein
MDVCTGKDNEDAALYQLPREPKCPPIAVLSMHQDTFKSYYYSLDKGEVCAFPIKNVGSSSKALYKIFDADTNLEFYAMEDFTPTAATDLKALNPGSIYKLSKGKQKVILAVNTGDSTNTFKVSFGDAVK